MRSYKLKLQNTHKALLILPIFLSIVIVFFILAVYLKHFLFFIVPFILLLTLLSIYGVRVAQYFLYELDIIITNNYFELKGEKNKWTDINWHKIDDNDEVNSIVFKMNNGKVFRFSSSEKLITKEEFELWKTFQHSMRARISTGSSSVNYYRTRKVGLIIKAYILSYVILAFVIFLIPGLYDKILGQAFIFFGGTSIHLTNLIKKRKKAGMNIWS